MFVRWGFCELFTGCKYHPISKTQLSYCTHIEHPLGSSFNLINIKKNYYKIWIKKNETLNLSILKEK